MSTVQCDCSKKIKCKYTHLDRERESGERNQQNLNTQIKNNRPNWWYSKIYVQCLCSIILIVDYLFSENIKSILFVDL